MKQLISIIIPVYNVDTFLNRCLKSITNQTYRDLEIILINDGSTDRSGEICDAWASKDPRIKVHHTTNQGVAAARNWGLRIANGDYIGFADADDWAEPDMFEKLADTLEQYNADIAICGFEEKWPDYSVLKVSKSFRCYTKEEALRELILDRNMQSYVWNKLFRRECVPTAPFPPLKRMSDLAALHNFYRNAATIIEINLPLYHYIRRNNSLVGKDVSLETTIDYCIAQQTRYADLVSEQPEIRKTMQKKYISSLNSVRNKFCQEFMGKDNKDIREHAERIKNILFPFYSLHQSEIGRRILFNKKDDISAFLSDPENYDYDAYKKWQNRKRFLTNLLSHLRKL